VWDYPRPPRVEPVGAGVAVRLDRTTLWNTRRALRVVETASPPVYYLPRDEVEGATLVDLDPDDGSLCEWKGWATYLDVVVGGMRLRRAAWTYLDPFDDLGRGYDRLRGLVAVYPALFACFVDGERASAQPGGFYGGWITAGLRGPWKGAPGTQGW